VSTDDRNCRCDGTRMDRTGAGWECPVKRRMRQNAVRAERYRMNAEAEIYAVGRRRLRRRIAQKRVMVEQLTKDLDQLTEDLGLGREAWFRLEGVAAPPAGGQSSAVERSTG
jgi:hypothetical protein